MWGHLRVDRVLDFLQSFEVVPQPQASVHPPPPPNTFGSGGRGVGGSQFGRGDKHFGTLGIYVICGGHPFHSASTAKLAPYLPYLLVFSSLCITGRRFAKQGGGGGGGGGGEGEWS
jgi:hypothetical protein